MTDNFSYYNLFFRLIEKYGPGGFTGIDGNDPLMIELEENMAKNNQFFYIGDVVLFNIIYTSKRSFDMLGIEPSALTGLNYFQLLHPSEIERHTLGRTTLIKLAHELYSEGKGYRLFSSNYCMKNAEGKYSNFLMQFYIYYSTIPYKSVFTFKVQTNIDWFKMHKHGYHYYLGDDLSNFRYPDHELLTIGNVFSNREFDIIKLLEQGNSTGQIAEKLFLSPNTVNTHRRNILRKSGKANMTELLHELKEQGLL
jgi:DNA-binding CsgD family transcriptional regulator